MVPQVSERSLAVGTTTTNSFGAPAADYSELYVYVVPDLAALASQHLVARRSCVTASRRFTADPAASQRGYRGVSKSSQRSLSLAPGRLQIIRRGSDLAGSEQSSVRDPPTFSKLLLIGPFPAPAVCEPWFLGLSRSHRD